jgi:hypothetical protein
VPQIIPVAGYTREITGTGNYTSGGSSDLGGTAQVQFRMQVACTQIRLFYSNYFNTADVENTVGLASITVMASFQATANSGTPVQMTFGGPGNTSAVIPPGQQVYTDWYTVPGGLAVGQNVATRTYVQVASGATFVTGMTTQNNASINGFTSGDGDNYPQHTTIPANANGSNQLTTSGSVTAWYSGTNHYVYGPQYIDGIASDGVIRPIVGLVGDSILQGYAELIDQTSGAANRAMVINGFPWYSMARANETTGAIFTGVGFGQRLNRTRKCSVIVFQYGTNDLVGGSKTFSVLRTQTLQAWQFLCIDGQLLIPTTLLPRPTGTYTSTSGQTVNTGLAAYQAYNAWLRAPISAGAGASATYDAKQLGITIPYIADTASYIETDASNTTPGGPSNPNTAGYFWCGPGNNTNYTNDGVHPITNAVLLMVPAYTSAGFINAVNSSTPPYNKPKQTKFPGRF